MQPDSFIMQNTLGGRLPLNYNFVRCDVIPPDIKRIDMSYYDKRFQRRRDPQYGNEFLRILE
jgi:hypothetical protein